MGCPGIWAWGDEAQALDHGARFLYDDERWEVTDTS